MTKCLSDLRQWYVVDKYLETCTGWLLFWLTIFYVRVFCKRLEKAYAITILLEEKGGLRIENECLIIVVFPYLIGNSIIITRKLNFWLHELERNCDRSFHYSKSKPLIFWKVFSLQDVVRSHEMSDSNE